MKEKPQRSVRPLFELESENLTELGGPMGSERTSINWRKFFNSVDAAKTAAEKDYGKKIEWDRSKGPTRNSKPIDFTCSGDLGHVMYHIKRVTGLSKRAAAEIRVSSENKIRFTNFFHAMQNHLGCCEECCQYMYDGDGDLCSYGKQIIVRHLAKWRLNDK